MLSTQASFRPLLGPQAPVSLSQARLVGGREGPNLGKVPQPQPGVPVCGDPLHPRIIRTPSTTFHDPFCCHSLASRILHPPYSFLDLERETFHRWGSRDRLLRVHEAAEHTAPLWRCSGLLWLPLLDALSPFLFP